MSWRHTHPSTRWWTLVVVAMTQLVVVLDGTIVSIALPQAQVELGMTDSTRQWVVTGYALAFGALLLLGGRIADYAGRKLAFMIGMAGFGAASLYGGLAATGADLILARMLQGAFGALLAPAALALLTVTFPSGRERNTAFAVFGTVAGAGATIGLVLGGVLTEFADWRWCLLVNLVFVLVGVVAGAFVLSESKADGDNRYDVVGAVVVTAGLGALVYGFSLAENGWTNTVTLACFAVGVVLLAVFVWVESRVAQPLLPLRIVTDRVRGGTFLIQAITGSVMVGTTLYLTFHMQLVMGMSPLVAGLANLPIPFSIMATAPVVARLIPRVGPRTLMAAGPLIAAAALVYLSFVTADGDYWVQVFPALVVLGIGMAFSGVPAQNVALLGVAPHDAGVASAAMNSAGQIGGSIGLSIFTAIYAGTLGAHAAEIGPAALTEAYGATFLAAAIGLLVASVIAVMMLRGAGSRTNVVPTEPATVLAG